ncbi:cytochrome c oxidase subunit II [Trichothermofontia sp.]
MQTPKETVPTSLLTLTLGVVVTLVSLWFGQNHGLMPEEVSEQAPLVDRFFNLMMTIATALFLIVEGAIVLAVIRFRRKPGDDTDAPPIHGNLPLEIFWTAIPAVIVIGLGLYSVEVYGEMGGFENTGAGMMMSHSGHHHESMSATKPSALMGSAIAAPLPMTAPDLATATDPLLADKGNELPAAPNPKYGFGAAPDMMGKPADLVVDVLGLQYAWIFTYPDSGVVSGELHVPMGKSVQLRITAQDVIHSFWVPQFRLKQDALPGQPSQLQFVATKPGDYPIVCAELCGAYHGSMRSRVIVHSEEEFDAWLQSQVAQQTEPTTTVALTPAAASDTDFLTPYAQDLGVTPAVLTQLPH